MRQQSDRNCLLYAVLIGISFFFVGCTRNPASNETQEVLETVSTSSTTEATGNTAEEQWEDDALRALIPKPTADRVNYQVNDSKNINRIWLDGLDYSTARNYVDTLRAAGFNVYETLDDYPGQGFMFHGMSSDGIYLAVNYGRISEVTAIYDLKEEVNSYEGFIFIFDKRSKLSDIPPDLDQLRQPWGSNEYQSQLPEPPIPYSHSMEYPATDADGARYTLGLEYMGYMDIVSYAEALQNSGFTIHATTVIQPFNDVLIFSAKNSAGYSVLLTWLSNERGYASAILNLYAPSVNTDICLWSANDYRKYLPEPGATNWRQTNIDYLNGFVHQIMLEGLDYTAAKEYANSLQEAGFDINVNIQDDTERERFSFEAEASIQVTDETPGVVSLKNFTIRLIYDPSQTTDADSNYLLLEIVKK